VADEVRKAVGMSYGVVDELEFWEYNVTCFDKGSISGGLFTEYVNMFLKLKQESGCPSWVQSEEDEDKYIEERRGNWSSQDVNFQKCGATNFR
jgi:hypothetical protein